MHRWSADHPDHHVAPPLPRGLIGGPQSSPCKKQLCSRVQTRCIRWRGMWGEGDPFQAGRCRGHVHISWWGQREASMHRPWLQLFSFSEMEGVYENSWILAVPCMWVIYSRTVEDMRACMGERDRGCWFILDAGLVVPPVCYSLFWVQPGWQHVHTPAATPCMACSDAVAGAVEIRWDENI